MSAEVVYDLLNYLKTNNSKYEQKTIRLLKFLYDDVLGSLDLESSKQEYDGLSDLLNYFRDCIDDYIYDSDENIIDSLSRMIKDGKDEYIDIFFNKLDLYFLIVDQHLYDEVEFSPHTFVFNIYLFLKGYNIYNDNIEQFKTFIEEYSGFIQPGFLSDLRCVDDLCLGKKKQIIDKIFERFDFEKISVLKKCLDNIKKDMCVSCSEEKIDNILESIDYIIPVVSDVYELKENVSEKEWDFYWRKVEEIYSFYLEETDCFYAPILLYKNRFEYIQERYSSCLNQESYMNEILEYIKVLDNNLFSFLDSEYINCVDSFEVCMNIVFDSDTLREMLNKMIELSEVSIAFSSKNITKSETLKRINSLSSDQFKKVMENGQKVMLSYSDEDSIYDRMVHMYSEMFGVSASEIENDIVEHYNFYDTIDEFENGVDLSLDTLSKKQFYNNFVIYSEPNPDVTDNISSSEKQKKKGISNWFVKQK